MLDHDAAVDAPQSGPAGGFSPAELASIGRVLTYNDPQGNNADAAGEPTDRNVELLLDDPRTTRPADPKLKLRVKPRRVRAGHRTRLRFRVRSAGEPVKGAVVRFKGRRKRTNARGVAKMKVRVGKAKRARAKEQLGCTKRRASVRVRLR
jgi:hypothetical protein